MQIKRRQKKQINKEGVRSDKGEDNTSKLKQNERIG